MRVTLIHNPTAGDERLSPPSLLAALDEAGHETTYRAKTEIEQALQDPGDLVVVAGGDGTVKTVAMHLAAMHRTGRAVPLALLPVGTANNIAKSLGVLGTTRELIAGWPSALRRRIDVGVARAPWGEERFIEAIGGGLFAQLISRGKVEVDENPSDLLGHEIDRALLLLQRILESYAPQRWRITADGQDLSGDYLVVEAMNIRFIGPNIPLAPDADPGDGWLDVVTVSEADRAAIAGFLAGRLQGGADPPRLTVHRARRLSLTPPECDFHLDDALWPDPCNDAAAGRTTAGASAAGEVEVTLSGDAVEVLVSQGERVTS